MALSVSKPFRVEWKNKTTVGRDLEGSSRKLMEVLFGEFACMG
jgi:hypothetical protein